ncbi:MAG: DUF4139 domain-containing protein [Campylobacter sp.]|nr:DUF4139 domain-containing protein [Campylobacter sp.]
MKKIVLFFVLCSAVVGAGIDIYTDVVMVEKSSLNNKFSVPFTLSMSDIEISAPCDITDADFTNFRKVDDENSAKKSALLARQQALKDSYKVILNSNIDNISNIDNALTQNLTEQADIQIQLDLLSSVSSQTIFLKDLVVSANCKGVVIKYPLYDVVLDSKNVIVLNGSSISIKQSASLSNLDENLDKARVRFFSYSVRQRQNPAKFMPIYLQKESPAQIQDAPATMSVMGVENKSEDAVILSREVVEKTLHTFNFWQVDKVDIKARKDNFLTLNLQDLNATFSNYIDGYGTSKAYFMATFTPEFDVQEARTDYYFEDSFISSGYQSKLLKNEKAELFFGVNNFIAVNKELSDIMVDESIFGGNENSKSVWAYTITNNSGKSQRVNFTERAPVSTHEDIKVKILGDLGASVQKDGKVEKEFIIEANSSISFKFGYIVSKPTK